MKIGDYVRTEYGIAKYIKDKTTKYGMYYVVDKNIMTCNVDGWENCISGSNEIIKSSPNIIDLIEVGDYVNGIRVDEIKNGQLRTASYYDGYICHLCDDNEIKSIVTKEQFEEMQYRIGE